MLIEQKILQNNTWKTIAMDGGFDREKANLVFAFFGIELAHHSSLFEEIQTYYPHAEIVYASTAGEILNTEVYDNSISLTAIHLEQSSVQTRVGMIQKGENITDIALNLARSLDKNDLKHVLIFGDGIDINGTNLIKGIKKGLGKNITLSGGLAADAGKFTKTYVSLNTPPDEVSRVVLVGLYGDIHIGLGSVGGWEEYGEPIKVTRSVGNIVYELDHKPILDFYKSYLGENAKNLPSSGLLFPLSIIATDNNDVVRTLLAIDEVEKSITFAGDIEEGSEVRLMRANFDKIIDAATDAGEDAADTVRHPELALLISCVGRKLILKDRTHEEVQSVKNIYNGNCKIAGFYSNGEIGRKSPVLLDCELHNQTMTVTIFAEK